MNSRIRNCIQASIATKEQLLGNVEIQQRIEEVAIAMITALKTGHRIYLCGNGGSAADAQHIAAELSGRFYSDRPALAAEALHCNTSYLTAIANDYSYDVVYRRLIEGIANTGDILIGLSTSGNSINILSAFEAANQKKLITVGLTGVTGGKLKDLCHYWLPVSSDDTPRIQETHILIGHILCQLVEEEMMKNG